MELLEKTGNVDENSIKKSKKEEISRLLSLGNRLKKMEWKIGLAVGSSLCENMNEPYVSAVFHIESSSSSSSSSILIYHC